MRNTLPDLTTGPRITAASRARLQEFWRRDTFNRRNRRKRQMDLVLLMGFLLITILVSLIFGGWKI